MTNIDSFMKTAAKSAIHHYEEDLILDLENMKKWFSKEGEKYFYVMLRDCGSYAFKLKDVFLKDTPPNLIWQAYALPVYKSSSPIKAYAVKVEKLWGGNLLGYVKQISYESSARDVQKNAIETGRTVVQLSNGDENACGKKCPCRAHPDCPVVAKRRDNVTAIRVVTLPADDKTELYHDLILSRQKF